MSNFSMKGIVQSISPAQQKGNFEWRELNLKVEKQVGDKVYEDVYQFQVSGKSIDTLTDASIGCEAEIFFNIRSREYNGKYYTNLTMWKMTYEPNAGSPGNYSQNSEASVSPVASDDDLPF